MELQQLLLFLILESSVKSTDIDYSLYSSKQLSPDYRVHWRILKEQKEIEVIMVVNGTSWVGLGWRPRQLTAKCRNFPVIKEIGAKDPVSEPEPEVESESEPEPESKSAASEPSSEPEPSAEVTPEPSAEATAEPSAEVTAEPSSEPKSKGAASEPSSEPEPPSSEPEATSEPPKAEPGW